MKSLIDHNESYYHFFLLGLHICIVDRKKHHTSNMGCEAMLHRARDIYPYVLFSKRGKERKLFKYGITISKYNPK